MSAVVLAVGVDLDRVGEAQRRAGLKPSHRGALAAVPLAPDHPGEPVPREAGHRLAPLGAAPVVDDQDVDDVRADPLDDGPNGERVVVGRDDGTGAAKSRAGPSGGGSRSSPRRTPSPRRGRSRPASSPAGAPAGA